MSGLFVEEVGTGPRVLLVHGSGDRVTTWADQRCLANRFRLVIPDRRGYGESPAGDPGFDNDAADIAALLEAGSHSSDSPTARLAVCSPQPSGQTPSIR